MPEDSAFEASQSIRETNGTATIVEYVNVLAELLRMPVKKQMSFNTPVCSWRLSSCFGEGIRYFELYIHSGQVLYNIDCPVQVEVVCFAKSCSAVQEGDQLLDVHRGISKPCSWS